MSTNRAAIPAPYQSLPLLVPPWYGPIPTPEFTTLYNLVGSLALSNELICRQIFSGALIWHLCGDYQALNYCPPYCNYGFFGSPEVWGAKETPYYHGALVYNIISTVAYGKGKYRMCMMSVTKQNWRFQKLHSGWEQRAIKTEGSNS